MTLNEAAAILATSAAVLRQAIARGSLKAVKRGRDWFVTAKEVERYSRENRRALRGQDSDRAGRGREAHG